VDPTGQPRGQRPNPERGRLDRDPEGPGPRFVGGRLYDYSRTSRLREMRPERFSSARSPRPGACRRPTRWRRTSHPIARPLCSRRPSSGRAPRKTRASGRGAPAPLAGGGRHPTSRGASGAVGLPQERLPRGRTHGPLGRRAARLAREPRVHDSGRLRLASLPRPPTVMRPPTATVWSTRREQVLVIQTRVPAGILAASTALVTSPGMRLSTPALDSSPEK
jgi:hypothetical protein